MEMMKIFTDLQGQITEQASQITEQAGQITEQAGKITALHWTNQAGQITALQDEVSSWEQKKQIQAGQITALHVANQAQADQLTTLQNEIAPLKLRVQGLEKDKVILLEMKIMVTVEQALGELSDRERVACIQKFGLHGISSEIKARRFARNELTHPHVFNKGLQDFEALVEGLPASEFSVGRMIVGIIREGERRHSVKLTDGSRSQGSE